MAEIVSYGKTSGDGVKGENPFKSLKNWFIGLNKTSRLFIITGLLIVSATPFLVNNLLETRQRASGPNEFHVEIHPPGPLVISPKSKGVGITAVAFDASSNQVRDGVTYEWGTSSVNSAVTLTRTSGDLTEIVPKNLGDAEVYVIARLGSETATKTLRVVIAEGGDPGGTYPLSFVQIQPPGPVTINTQTRSLALSALAYDIYSKPMFRNVTYEWGASSVNSAVTLKKTTGNITEVLPRTPGIAEVYVIARSGTESATKTLQITVVAPSPTPTTVPSDSDRDGFSDSREIYLGTNPNKKCADNSIANNEGGQDAWPLDFDDSQKANTIDVGKYIPVLNKKVGQPGFSTRYDLNQDGVINTIDTGLFTPQLNKTCL
jgi:hypothetical protein